MSPSASGPAVAATPWTPRQAAVLRLAVVYVSLYSFTTQFAGGVLLLPGEALPALGHVWPMREVTLWLATHAAGLPAPLAYSGNSGDTAFHWVQLSWLAVTAVVMSVCWVWARRPRIDDDRLHAWFRLGLRFVLAGQMFYYGMAKVVPSQFQAPSLVTLVQPVGSLSLSDLLWTFIGASTPYQVSAGLAEVAAGVLLVVPWTAPLGAVLCVFDMAQVFLLNMTYDFGLKQLSFHLLVFSLALLLPDTVRIRGWLFRGRALPPRPEEWVPGVVAPRAHRAAVGAQMVWGLYLLVMFTSLSLHFWRTEGGGRPRAPLYGIWDVTELWMDGAVVSPADADYDRRWRRVIFDAPDVLAFQRLDDSIAHYGVTFNEERRAMELSKGRSRTWRATFTYDSAEGRRLTLSGEMDGHHLQVRLTRLDLDTFRLRGSRFRWVRPSDPFAG